MVILSLLVIAGLAYCANYLAHINPVIEFPIWAAVLGIIVGNLPRISNKLKLGANPEFFIKIGLILLGSSINFAVIMSVGARGIIQVLIGMPLVFFFTWYCAKWFGLEDKLRAVMATALSICGVSAAIAATGAVLAKKEQLTYIIALVILFALPLMVIMPYTAQAIGLSPAVAGAWIGNNIDTTAAVIGAGAIHGEEALKVASVVKMTQNVFIGIVAFLLALYFCFKVERGREKPKVIELWYRFPKFVFGFLAISLMVTFGVFSSAEVKVLSNMRKWFFCLAFVCIGMSFNFKEMRKIGGKPLLVFAICTAFNTATALGLGWLLFNDYEVS